MSARGLVESSPDADRTMRAPQTIFPHISQTSLQENNDSPSSSKASLVAQQKLGDFFPSLALAPHTATANTKYTDASLQQIANLLRLSDRKRWSAVPRLYTVLRSIGQLQLIDEFIDEGFTDIWFPFTPHNLPPRLSPSIKTQFLTTQSVVFTQALDLEKREGRHATFAADEPLWFESKGKLGRGAFGVVDKVVSLITLQEYARKRMRRGNNFTRSKKEIKEFKAELAILKTVNHHHCVRLVGSYTDPVYLGLIMDPVADCDLGRFLAEALTNNDKKSLLRGYFGCLASALRYLHDRQIRHRDIKPPNILVKGDTVYLADFGIALDWSEMTRGTTTADTAKSPIYCAPEVARSEPRGQSADIWSLGCVFVEMVTVLKGSSVDDMRSSFKKTSGSYMFHHNVQACDHWLSELKDKSAVDNPPIEWCQKMLLFDRNERYTASQLLEAIQIESEPDHSKYINQSFCGDCCMDQEHVSSNDSDDGDDPWADSEEEDTLRARDASIQKSDLEHMPDIIVPGKKENTSDVLDMLIDAALTGDFPRTYSKLSYAWGVPSTSTTNVSLGERSLVEAVVNHDKEPPPRKQQSPTEEYHNMSELEGQEVREENYKGAIEEEIANVSLGEHSSLETAMHQDQEPPPGEQQSPTNESQNTSELERLAREEWREEDYQKAVAEWNVTDAIGLGKQRRRTSKEAEKRDEEKAGQDIAAAHAGQEQLEGAETIELVNQITGAFEEVEWIRRGWSETATRTAEESDNQDDPASLVAPQVFLPNPASITSISSATAPTALQVGERQIKGRYNSEESEEDAATRWKRRTETNVAAARAEKERRDARTQEMLRRKRAGNRTTITTVEDFEKSQVGLQEITRRRRERNDAATHESMPPFPRAATFTSEDRRRDRDGSRLRIKVTSDSESDSPIHQSPQHPPSRPPQRLTKKATSDSEPGSPIYSPPRYLPSPPPPKVRKDPTSDSEPDSPIHPPSGYSSRYSHSPPRAEEEKKKMQLVESVFDLREGEREESPTNGETKEVPPITDRWEKIRRNAAERAVKRQIEEQSRGGYNQKTDEDIGDTSGEETMESRVARIKARVAELTANTGTPNNQTSRSQPRPKVGTENEIITIQPKPKSKYKADVPKPPEPAMNDSNIGRAYPMPDFGRTPDVSLPMAPHKVSVTITIHSASGLKRIDLFRSPDPYVLMTVERKRYTTSTATKTTNPFWGSKFDVNVTNDSMVDLYVMADGKHPATVLGIVASLRIGDYLNLRSDKAIRANLPLKHSKNSQLTVEFKPKIHTPKR